MAERAAENGAETAQLLGGIRGWVEIESPTTAPDAVNRLADRVASEYAAFGAALTRIPGRDGYGDHLLAEIGPASASAGDKGLLVLSHLDTVHPLGTLAGRLPFRVEGEHAYGPGIYDMKGGAYLGLAALRALAARPGGARLPVRHLLVSDEEVGSHTSRTLIEAEARRALAVLVTEPAREGGRIVTARKGVARFELRVRGRAAHAGSRHEDGRSAVAELARQILALEAMTDRASGVTVNVGVIRGGTRANVVADEAYAEIDMRVPSVALGEAMVARVLGLAAQGPDVSVEVTGGLNRPGYEKSEAVAALFERAQAIAREIGFDLRDIATGGGSDGNFTATIAPTLDGLGVDGDGAHTLAERLLIPSLVPRRRLLTELMESLGA